MSGGRWCLRGSSDEAWEHRASSSSAAAAGRSRAGCESAGLYAEGVASQSPGSPLRRTLGRSPAKSALPRRGWITVMQPLRGQPVLERGRVGNPPYQEARECCADKPAFCCADASGRDAAQDLLRERSRYGGQAAFAKTAAGKGLQHRPLSRAAILLRDAPASGATWATYATQDGRGSISKNVAPDL